MLENVRSVGVVRFFFCRMSAIFGWCGLCARPSEKAEKTVFFDQFTPKDIIGLESIFDSEKYEALKNDYMLKISLIYEEENDCAFDDDDENLELDET